jgi:hypothetical protein
MPGEASVDTSPVRHTFLKLAAPNSWRLWTYDAQVWMPGDAANSACGSQKVGISTDGRAPETVWKVRKGQRYWQNDECPLLADFVAKVG